MKWNENEACPKHEKVYKIKLLFFFIHLELIFFFNDHLYLC